MNVGAGPVSAPATIDVICATYNRSALLRGAIDSVLAQTVTDWRMVIVSDASTDDTAAVVGGYSDPRITFLECTPRRRPGGPRNVGLGVSSSPYVTYLDDDDRWEPDHLEKVLGLLRGGAPWVVAGCAHVTDDGRAMSAPGLFNSVWHPDLQLLSPMFEPSRVAHTRALTDALGAWTEGVNRDDWDLWLRFTDHGVDVAISPEPTVRVRVSESTMRHTPAYDPDWFTLRLGSFPSEEAARAAREAIQAPEQTARFRELFIEDVRAWFAAMHDSGRMALPPGGTREGLLAEWDALSSQMPANAPVPIVDEMRYAAAGSEHLLVCRLPCLDATHGERIQRVQEAHGRRRLGLIRAIGAQYAR